MDIKKEIISSLKGLLEEFTKESIEFLVEKPENENFGDYASNIALVLFKDKGLRIKDKKLKAPLDLAQIIAEKLNHSSLIINHCEKVEAVKPGFVNFFLSKEYLLANLEKIINKKDYGSKPQDLNKKVIVEYSSPNIAKPFTVGHLRSTIIGSAIANLLEANGWKVKRDNHLGDWGTQFGKQIYAIKTWGNEEKIEKSENPVKELVALYVKFHEEAEKNPELEEKAREWFKKLENGDSEARRLWKKCVDWSLKDFKVIYDKLGIKFTENNGLGYGESFFENKIKEVLDELNEKRLLKESEGAKLVFFEKDPPSPKASAGQAKYPPLMIIKKDGATLYATRDLATDKFRLKEYGKDIVVINEVGIEQTLYFRQLFEVEKMLGWYKDGQRIHKRHGHYRFKDEKMSTRKGNTIWLEDVLEEAVKRAEKLGQVPVGTWLGSEGKIVAQAVGIGAIKWNDLKRTSEQDIVFDWDEILNMQGDSGPYLQYTFARTQSVLAKASIGVMPNSFRHLELAKKEILNSSKRTFLSGGGAVQDDNGMEQEEVSLLRSLYRFPEVVGEAGEKFAPNLLCNYLFDLAQKFNLFYQKHKILSISQGVNVKHPKGVIEREKFRVGLTAATGVVIKKGLNLLGISAPERM